MTMQSVRRLLAVTALCAVAAAMTGCATASKPEALVPVTIDLGIQHAQTTSVAVSGGKETSSLGKSQISNEAFQQAIAMAIEKSKTFAAVVKGAGGDYALTVTVVNLEQPMFGLSFTVKMETAWSLKKADGSVVMQESIRSEGTAGALEAFAGSERLRLANEAAARNNIAAGLQKIGQLKF